MSYSVFFFAMNANAFAERMQVDRPALLEASEHLLRQNHSFSSDEIQRTVAKIGQICEGQLPDPCAVEYFHALCWLAESATEKIPLGSFLLFRRIDLLDEIGVWTMMQGHACPFRLPRSDDNPPAARFVPLVVIRDQILPRVQGLPSASYAEADNARQDMIEVMESLCEDQLDLLTVML